MALNIILPQPDSLGAKLDYIPQRLSERFAGRSRLQGVGARFRLCFFELDDELEEDYDGGVDNDFFEEGAAAEFEAR